jgi:hypothetical protein
MVTKVADAVKNRVKFLKIKGKTLREEIKMDIYLNQTKLICLFSFLSFSLCMLRAL